MPVDDRLYFTNLSTFYCLDRTTRHVVFKEEIDRDEWMRNSAFLADGTYIYGTGRRLVARNVDRGEAIWRFEGEFDFGPPFVHGGRVYATCVDGHIYRFNAAASASP